MPARRRNTQFNPQLSPTHARIIIDLQPSLLLYLFHHSFISSLETSISTCCSLKAADLNLTPHIYKLFTLIPTQPLLLSHPPIVFYFSFTNTLFTDASTSTAFLVFYVVLCTPPTPPVPRYHRSIIINVFSSLFFVFGVSQAQRLI